MDWFTRRFIKASLVWLCVGVSIGVAMAVHPAWAVYRPAHLHALLLGFVAMMIFGVAYHVIPRFAGHPLRHPALAGAHWMIANAGLALMVIGFIARVASERSLIAGAIALSLGGSASAVGAFAFAFNIWRTMDAATARERAVRERASRSVGLPVA